MRKFIALFFAIIPLQITFAESYLESKLNSNNDHGLWLIQEIEKDIGNDFSMLLQFEQRWGSDYRLFWYHEYELILYYDATECIKKCFNLKKESIFNNFSIGYGCADIQQLRRNTRGVFHWVDTTRPLCELDLILSWKGWDFGQRIRGQYNKFNASHYRSHGTFRYRMQLQPPWEWTCFKIQPFISNEIFVRVNTWSKSNTTGVVGGLHEDRLRIGFNSTLIKDRLGFQAWWQWRALKQNPETSPRWFNTYAYGLRVDLSF